jgi:hypothetical protein
MDDSVKGYIAGLRTREDWQASWMDLAIHRHQGFP